jgi:hypothetical protein
LAARAGRLMATAVVVLRVVGFLVGAALAFSALASAVRTFVLPRSAPDPITRIAFLGVRRLFRLRLLFARSYLERDRIMALYAPIGLIVLPLAWLMFVLVGYTCMYWALGAAGWERALILSGSSLLTLGFAAAETLPMTLLAFSEAAVGLLLLALLISYLPTMYAAFSRREAAVTLLEVRAGSPPSALEMLERYHRLGRLERLQDLWVAWEAWFAELEESHTSLAALVFFRSPNPTRAWVTAAGAVLDAGALTAATLDIPRNAQVDLCIRAGYLALREIAEFFRIPFVSDPRPDDPISVSREEFESAYDRLAAAGLPLKSDRAQAWRDFAGWRVNYDSVLLDLAELTMAPPDVPWSTDTPRAEAARLRRSRSRNAHARAATATVPAGQ